jgi:hypothetical protein
VTVPTNGVGPQTNTRAAAFRGVVGPRRGALRAPEDRDVAPPFRDTAVEDGAERPTDGRERLVGVEVELADVVDGAGRHAGAVRSEARTIASRRPRSPVRARIGKTTDGMVATARQVALLVIGRHTLTDARAALGPSRCRSIVPPSPARDDR